MTAESDNQQPESIPLSLVAHTAFCPRRTWLEAVGERVDSYQMQVGKAAHKRVDDPGTGSGKHRAVNVSSIQMSVVGRCDVVEESDSGVIPVEYKATPIRLEARVTEANRTQLALQKLCLEEAGYRVPHGRVHFTTHNKSVDVELTPVDLQAAIDLVAETRRIIIAESAPPPLEDSPKCRRCSHVGICLPDERKLTGPARRILVADPDAQVIHVATPGSRATVHRGRLVVQKGSDELASVPLERVQGLIVFGNVDVSSALQRELLWRDLTIVFCSGTGRVYGWTRPARSANGGPRLLQHVSSFEGRLDLAREFVSSKIANQATQLRRNSSDATTVKELRKHQKSATKASTLDQLYGIEGEAASLYFGAFRSMLSETADKEFGLKWPGRTGRSARDPLNAALNFAYSLLLTETIRALVACGLDPHAGFLHSSNRNKPALALDLMEEFRAPIADSAVIRAINNGELDSGDFDTTLGASRLTVSGRKTLISGIGKRMDTEIVHPVFRYKASWRRIVEIQARQILGVLDGSQKQYLGMRVR